MLAKTSRNAEIVRNRESGMKMNDIATRHGISRGRVRQIIQAEKYHSRISDTERVADHNGMTKRVAFALARDGVSVDDAIEMACGDEVEDLLRYVKNIGVVAIAMLCQARTDAHLYDRLCYWHGWA